VLRRSGEPFVDDVLGKSDLARCHDTQFIAAKVSTTGRLLTLMMPMPG
jgi:hypothetical protein